MNIKFTTDPREVTKDTMILYSGKYVYGNGISIEAWDDEEPYAMVTENIPGIPLAEKEVILHHDLITTNGFDGRDFISDFLDYMTTGHREITFGPYNTKTLVVTLCDDWETKVVKMEV